MSDEIRIQKDHAYLAIIGMLVLLVIASVASGGFGSFMTENPATALADDNLNDRLETQGVPMESLAAQGMKLGSDAAPIVMVEFSDFQCPYCRSFWQESLTEIKRDYIDTGKVQLIYRHYPLGFHRGARPAALAVECANEQGLWLAMHEVIFQKQAERGQGTISFSTNDLKSWAREVAGLNAGQFDTCMDLGKYNAKIEQDLQAGSEAGVSGTPAFFIGKRGGRGLLVTGAQPYSTFRTIFEQLG